MPASELRLIKRCAEFGHGRSDLVPHILADVRSTRKETGRQFALSTLGWREAKGWSAWRMRSHSKSKTKGKLWTHFSLSRCGNNITQAEVAELEGCQTYL